MTYDKWFPRFTQSKALLDRETRKRYVTGMWIKVSIQGKEYQGVIGYIGTKFLHLAVSQLGTGRAIEKLIIRDISEIEVISALWKEPVY